MLNSYVIFDVSTVAQMFIDVDLLLIQKPY